MTACSSVDCLAVVSVGVAPPIMEISVPQGGVRVMDVQVYNQGDSPVDIRGYLHGIELSTDGTPLPIEADRSDWSCARWITLDKAKFQLGPNQTQTVHATMRVPMGITGGRYAVIMFEAAPVKSHLTPYEVAVSTRVGSIVMQSVPHTLVKKGEVASFDVSNSEEKAVGFAVLFRNTGNVHVRAKGYVLIRNGEGRIADRIPLRTDTGTVLPGGMREFEATWSNLRKMHGGDYTAEVRVDYGGTRAASDTASFHL